MLITLYPTVKILALIKLKAFSDDKLNVAKIIIYVFNKVKNIMGKGENADNSLPKILALTKLKALADDKFNVAKMIISVFDRMKNIMGKGENAGYQHFLLFP